MSAICRDCLSETHDDGPCHLCGSPRVLRHPELFDLAVAHIDCDAFYASVEKRDDPSLADRPVIIGGGKRGVVSTACYLARLHGVRSAMPMFKALKACPDAVVIRPDMAKYVAVSRQIRERFQAVTPLIEPLSLDEAFLDLSGTERLHGGPPALTLARLAQQIREEVGVTVSVGLSDCKFLAKIASDLEKPRGFCVIGRGEAIDFLEDKPIGIIWGVGAVSQRRLAADGLRMVGDVRALSLIELQRRYGSMGTRLHELSHARDLRCVNPSEHPKSVSSETTFNEDISDAELLESHLWRLCEKVSARCKAKSLGGMTVTLKLKSPSFRTITRASSERDPVQLTDTLFRVAEPLLKREVGGQSYRLIGVGLSNLVDLPDETEPPADLLDPDAPKRARAERAVDTLRAKFGEDAVKRGRAFKLD